jgi:hypothetical protein
MKAELLPNPCRTLSNLPSKCPEIGRIGHMAVNCFHFIKRANLQRI